MVSGSGSGGGGVGARGCRSGREVVMAQSRMDGCCWPYRRVDIKVDARDVESGVLDRRAFEGGEVHCLYSHVCIHKYIQKSKHRNSENKRPNDGHDYNNIITDQNEE